MAAVGERVWVGEREGCFSVWDFKTGERLMRSTKKKELFVFAITGPVDGSFVWLGYSDGVIRIFNAESMTLVKEIKSHSGAVNALTGSDSGRYVFSASTDFTIVKWDGESMTRAGHYMGHSNHVRSLLVVGGRLYSGADDNTIRVWEIAKGRCVSVLTAHSGGIKALAVSGKYLWSASDDNSIRIWDTSTPELTCHRELTYPHSGQINCLCLIGSLMWSNSWSHLFIWDTATFELKGQYDQAHEGCIGAVIPVHQSVVTRVWSAAVEGEICMWNTECTFASALHAATDSRLEAALLQIDEARRAQEELEAERRDLAEENGQLRAEFDRLQFSFDSQGEKHEQAQRDLLRHVAEAQDSAQMAKGERDDHRRRHDVTSRELLDVKDKHSALRKQHETLGGDHEALLAQHRDLQDQLAKALQPKSPLRPKSPVQPKSPASSGLQPAAPRDTFASRSATPGSPGSDEDALLVELARALRDGDASAAARLREMLDRDFPAWRLRAGDIVVPHQYDASVDGEPRRQRDAFVQGMLLGPRSEVPPPFMSAEGLSPDEKDQRARFRQAYTRGQVASTVVPSIFSADEATFSDAAVRAGLREAFLRGLGTEQLMPEEYAGDTPPLVGQRAAFERGKAAVRRVPEQYRDIPYANDDERERLRALREAFLRGLAAGPDGVMPKEFQDSPHLDAAQQLRRRQLRDAFRQGQEAQPVVPDPVTTGRLGETPASPPLGASFSGRSAPGTVGDDKSKEAAAVAAVMAAAEGDGAADDQLDVTGREFGGTMSTVPSSDPVAHAAALHDAQEAYLKGLGVGSAEPELPSAWQDDSRLSQTERERRKMCREAYLHGAAAAPKTVPAQEAARLRQIVDDQNEELARLEAELDQIRREFRQAPADLVDLRAQMASYAPLPKSPGSPGSGHGGLAEPLDERVGTSPLSATQVRRQDFLRRKGLLKLGGEPVAELPALDEMDDPEQHRIDSMIRKYQYPERDSLPAFDDLEPEDQEFLNELMAKYRRGQIGGHSSPAPPHAGSQTPLGGSFAPLGGGMTPRTPGLPGSPRSVKGSAFDRSQSRHSVPGGQSSAMRASPHRGRSPSVDPRTASLTGSFVGQTSSEDAGPAASTQLSEAAQRALEHPDLPSEARSGLEATVLTTQDRTPGQVRKVLSSPALPGGTAHTLRETLETADAGRAVELSAALRRATQSSQLPPETRKAMQGALDSKERLGRLPQAEGEWADEMSEGARKALQHPGLPADVRQDLGTALAAADNKGADVAVAARAAARDPALPKEARELLVDVASPHAPPSAVPEAVRDLLFRSGEAVPEVPSGTLRKALEGYDGRHTELASAVRSAPGKPADTLQRDLGSAMRLPVATRALAHSHSTPSETRRALRKALKVWQGRQEAVDDAARNVLSVVQGPNALPPAARMRLRTALTQGGAGTQEVAEAVRWVLATEGKALPAHIQASLRHGLAASDGRAVPLRNAVSRLQTADVPEETASALADALSMNDGLTPTVALSVRAVQISSAGPDFRRKLTGGLHAAVRRREDLSTTCSSVAESGQTPPEVAAALRSAVEHFKGRGTEVKQAADGISTTGLSAEVAAQLRAARSIDSGGAEVGIDGAREALQSAGLADADRRKLQTAIAGADSASADLRSAAHDAAEAIRPHRALSDAVASVDSEARDLLAAVQGSLTADLSVPPDVRAQLHDVLRDAALRESALSECARDITVHHPRLSAETRRAISDALAVTQGRPVHVVNAARQASRDHQVPIVVRKVLLEALGEDPMQTADLAFDAAHTPGMPKSRQEALTDALAVADASDAQLVETVRSVVGRQADDAVLPAGVARGLQSASTAAADSFGSLLGAARAATTQRDVPEDVRELLHDRQTGGRPEKVVEAVRSSLRHTGVPGDTRGELSTLSMKTSVATVELADAVRGALGNAELAADSPARKILAAALTQWEQGVAKLTEQAQKAAADPRVPPVTRQELSTVAPLADTRRDQKESDLAEVVRFVLRQPGVPPSRHRALSKALSAVDGDRSVDEALREAERDAGLNPEARSRAGELRSAASGNRRALNVAARALLDSPAMPQDAAVRSQLTDGLATAEGHRIGLDRAAREGAGDPAMPEMPRRMLQDAVGAIKVSDQALTLRAVLQQPGVPDEVRKQVQRALDDEKRTPLDQAWRFQSEQLRAEMEQKLKELKAAEERAELNQAAADLIALLGGPSAAQALLENRDAPKLKQVSDAVAARERELADLKSQIAASQGAVPREFEAGDDSSAEDRKRKQELQEAYLRGKVALPHSPLPAEYQPTDGPAADVAKRQELADAWLRGRQDGLGSAVPWQYADAEGLPHEERQRRRLLRLAFWDGLVGESSPRDDAPGAAEAFGLGREQRKTELRRLGAPDGFDSSDEGAVNITHRFGGGLRGELEDLIDPAAAASAAGDTGTVVDLATAWCRGRWLRQDVLGEGAALSASPQAGPAGTPHASPGMRGRDLPGSPSSSAQRGGAAGLLELAMWRQACLPVLLSQLGFENPVPDFLKLLQTRFEELQQTLDRSRADRDDVDQRYRDMERRSSVQLEEHMDKSRRVESDLRGQLVGAREQIEKERKQEVQRLQSLIAQLESDLERKEQQNNSLARRMKALAEQLGAGSEQAEQQELVQRAYQGDVGELVQYYKDREKKWREMGDLNAELMHQQERMLGESEALAQKLRDLSFVFDSRPTLIRSLYELYRVLAKILDRGGVVDVFSKEAATRQLPRLDILQQIKGVAGEVEVGKEGSRWIIANLFTAYELQHLGTSPSFFVPDGRRPTWRDIQVPPRVREHLLRQEEEEWVEVSGSPKADPQRQSPPPHSSQRQSPREGGNRSSPHTSLRDMPSSRRSHRSGADSSLPRSYGARSTGASLRRSGGAAVGKEDRRSYSRTGSAPRPTGAA
eukprot:TRINITY_DN8694_c0_g1_i1.p1 TRINITY_DN8694_c0_g1~~TRINITY_DN8694_c0_g1_i1.p1  ORF type:complete len:3057 (+),score=1321.40 TRINITY_DN8694_c0_g1_i1:432-9173(+)